ncbi:MAG: hypothetical protein AMJ62_07840 [Myxococcales bacterium SG8_38]|nr:MAG: hypothetical protein AMJ62_07840 [Myxococcales bacterium SG8_38]
MFRRFAIRDLLILAATVGLWWLSLAVAPGTTLASVLSISAGVGAAVCAYDLHEWGHLLGAHLTDSVYVPARRVISPFLFSYDAERNTRAQFLVMSLAGFAATAVFVLALWLWMPQDQLAGRIAWRGALVLAALTVVIELPIFFRALLGKTVPRTGMFKGPTVGGSER